MVTEMIMYVCIYLHTVLARLYAPLALPPLRGLSYSAGFLSRKHALPPPPRSDLAVYTHALTRSHARDIESTHACVSTYVAQSFYSNIMSNNMKKDIQCREKVDSLSLSTYVIVLGNMVISFFR